MKNKRNKLLIIPLIVCMILQVTYIPVSAYSARTSAPNSGNGYFYSNSNPFYAGGYTGQCTWYAFGRAYEILGSRPKLSTGNANKWYSYNQQNGYYNYGTEPRVGAIACYNNHVAVVENITNGVTYVSEFNNGGDRSFHYRKYNEWGSYPNGYIYITNEGGGSSSGCTSHVKGTYLWPESMHPHYNYYKCANCGATFTDGSTQVISSCEICNPKVEVSVITDKYEPGNAEYFVGAGLSGSAHANGAPITETGMYFGTSTGNMTKMASARENTYDAVFFYNTMTYGMTVSKNYTYYYRAYAVAGGKTFLGNIMSFTMIAEDEIWAVWNNSFTLSYDASGGSEAPEALYYSGEDYSSTHVMPISSKEPVRDGYKFMGWSTDKNSTIADYASGTEIRIGYDTTLYAVWQKDGEPLTFTNSDSYNIPATYLGVPIKPIDVSGGVSGGTKPYKFTAQNLNPGIEISIDGIISGTPEEIVADDGTPARITVTDAESNSKSIEIKCGPVYAGSVNKPSVKINYNSEVINLGSGMEYRFKNESSWKKASYNTKLDIEDSDLYGETLFIRNVEGNIVSDVQELQIPEKRKAPLGIYTDGSSIYGVSSSMEYKKSGGSWSSCAGRSIDDLSAGTYYVRYAATSSNFCSSEAIVTVKIEQNVEQDNSEKGSFYDVSSNAYYYDAVQWSLERGVTSGTSTYTFSPDSYCTRAQAVTFLWRASGSPKVTGVFNPFYDVSESDYYYDAVMWAVKNGITSGTNSVSFSPGKKVNRAQTVAFLYRSKASGNGSYYTAEFYDVPNGTYYEDAVGWATSKGITSGTGNNRFSPAALCTRAQMVTFLYRAYEFN